MTDKTAMGDWAEGFARSSESEIGEALHKTRCTKCEQILKFVCANKISQTFSCACGLRFGANAAVAVLAGWTCACHACGQTGLDERDAFEDRTKIRCWRCGHVDAIETVQRRKMEAQYARLGIKVPT